MSHDTDPLRAVQAARLHEPGGPPDEDGLPPAEDLVLILCVGPHQINRLEGREEVTVTYPVGADHATVLSAQPNGTWALVPRDIDGALNAGPYERALVQTDRVVFAPLGIGGHAFIVPYSDRIPNV